MDLERLGPYRIVGKLGRGGMGVVYEGVHRETGEPAAVKLLSAALAQEEGFRARFEAEIETLRKLNHPNIVRLFGFGEQDGHLFYAMELVDGNSLEEELRRGRRFDWREAARIGVEMCKALRHAHDRGIIHRDIKPGNLLLTADARLKLSDFGIARLFGNSRLTGAGSVLGTAEYMAPEQAEGRPVDARSDLYSLGALMYALLTRRPVFSGKSLVEVLHKQRFEQPAPLRSHAVDAPEEFELILGQLLEKDPARRIPNANLLGRRLEAMLHALSVGSETMEADAGWFAENESDAEREADRSLPPAEAPTIELPAARQAAGAESKETAPAAPSTASPGRFVLVGEDELDRPEHDEPDSAMISWQTWALAASLIAVGMTVWWFLQPPSADALFQRIVKRTDNLSIEAIPDKMTGLSDVEDAFEVIKDFSSRFPNDPRCVQLLEYENELDLRRMELKFEIQVKERRRAKSLTPAELMYLEAIGNARLDPTRAMVKLQALVDLFNNTSSGDLATTERCITLAQRRLDPLRREVEKQAAQQLPILRQRLDAADALRNSEPQRALAVYRAVVALYDEMPWAADEVDRARAAILNMKEIDTAREQGVR